MVWYLVYTMLLVHFQITRLMPGKYYGGNSTDVILKLILFIENVIYRFICQWKMYSRISHHCCMYRKRYLQMTWYLVCPMVQHVPVCSEYIDSANDLVSPEPMLTILA